MNYQNRAGAKSKVFIPALLTLHVRSQNLQKQLSTLVNAGIERLYISIDGPRNEIDSEEQRKIIEVISEYQKKFELLKVRKARRNMGLAVGMISAIDWFFLENEMGMVIEDDLVFESETINFLQNGIQAIRENPRILLVGGSQPFPEWDDVARVNLTNYPQIWGWATTRSKWLEMRHYFFHLPKEPKYLNANIRNFWKVGWLRVQEGYLDTWDLPIAAGMLFDNKYCLLPPVNLISNIGVDGYSTNTNVSAFPLGEPINKKTTTIDFEINLDFEDIRQLNCRFDKEIYRIKKRNYLSNIKKHFDYLRLRKRKKAPLLERIDIVQEFKIEIYE